MSYTIKKGIKINTLNYDHIEVGYEETFDNGFDRNLAKIIVQDVYESLIIDELKDHVSLKVRDDAVREKLQAVIDFYTLSREVRRSL